MSYSPSSSCLPAESAAPTPEQPLKSRGGRIHVEGPDFICIGLPKAATGWLYDQLQFHPDFWMPPLKELHYLGNDITPLGRSQALLSRMESTHAGARRSGERVRRKDLEQKRSTTERDLWFLQATYRLRGQPRDWTRYKNLFSVKGEQLSGDITPGYCRLGEPTIAQIAANFPSTKILLLVRDPVSRIWSELSMAGRKGYLDKNILEDPKAFGELIDKKRQSQITSRPTAILERWTRYFPDDRFRYILFDDIAADPAQALQRILLYLGADPARKSSDLAVDYNRKAVRKKLEMSGAIRAMLVDCFADEIRACAQVFGGAARNWPAKYGL